MRFLGIDLADPYAKKPRPSTVAIVDGDLACRIVDLPPLDRDLLERRDARALASWLERSLEASPDDVIVIDAPLALARSGGSTRACERALRAPGHTPSTLPEPGSRPFAGLLRAGVLLADALRHAGRRVLMGEIGLDAANLLEGFPGAAWPVLAGDKLPVKASAEGLRRRRELLEAEGLRFEEEPASHDALDAALCALLGRCARVTPSRVVAVGEPAHESESFLREGQILTVAGMSRGVVADEQTARRGQSGVRPPGVGADSGNAAPWSVRACGLTIAVHEGSIVDLKGQVDAFVSSDDEALSHGDGVSRAIWEAAGPVGSNKSGLSLGSILVTPAFGLDALAILHAVSVDLSANRRLGSHDARELYDALLDEAEELGFVSIAVPLVGAGAGRLTPFASAVALAEVLDEHAAHPRSLERVVVTALHNEVADLVRAMRARLHERPPLDFLLGLAADRPSPRRAEGS